MGWVWGRILFESGCKFIWKIVCFVIELVFFEEVFEFVGMVWMV